jgi:hypothetical protein
MVGVRNMTVDDLLRRLMWEIDELRSALIFGKPTSDHSHRENLISMMILNGNKH